MTFAMSSLMYSFAATRTSPVSGSTTSSLAYLPAILRLSFSISSLPSLNALTSIPSSVPQSISLMMMLCEISTRRLVRYPESAVLSAVSVSPLRAPFDEMKYSSMDRPSRKLALIGQTFTEVGLDRDLYSVTCSVRHKSSHSADLADLGFVTSRSGLSHDVEVVQ